MESINKKLTNYTVVLLIYTWQHSHTKIVTLLAVTPNTTTTTPWLYSPCPY